MSGRNRSTGPGRRCVPLGNACDICIQKMGAIKREIALGHEGKSQWRLRANAAVPIQGGQQSAHRANAIPNL